MGLLINFCEPFYSANSDGSTTKILFESAVEKWCVNPQNTADVFSTDFVSGFLVKS